MSRPGVASALLPLLGFAGGCDDPANRSAWRDADDRAPGLTDVTARLGLAWRVERGGPGSAWMPDSMTGGCALFDADGDGRIDLYVVHGVRDASGRDDGPDGANRLFIQEPDGTFRDATAASGLGDRGYGMGVAVGDLDGDGDEDLYLANHGRDRLYLNLGGGRFEDASDRAGIGNDGWSSSVGLIDHDGDGDLDIFVANYVDFEPGVTGHDAGGRPEYPSPLQYRGTSDVLWRNDGDGRFTDVSVASGIATLQGRGLGVAVLDLDGDGRRDVYVANDASPNFAWIAGPDGTFRERGMELGIAVNRNGRPEASMGIAIGDCDDDGRFDLLLTHLVQESNTLYLHATPGTWEDATRRAGLAAPSVDTTGFGCAFLDLDHDGDLDLAIANGRVLRHLTHVGATELPAHWQPYGEPNHLLRNDGAGSFALDVAGASDFAHLAEVSRGLAVGDLDRDGDLDLVVVNADGGLRVHRNDLPKSGRGVVLHPRGAEGDAAALGAIVEATISGGTARRIVGAGGSYLAHHESAAHFGIPDGATLERLVVIWPDGVRELFDPPETGVAHAVLRRGAGRYQGGAS